MISVQEAESILEEHLIRGETEVVDLARSNGRILAEPLVADRDFPPFDRVSMDGIAVSFDSFARGLKEYQIEQVASAGEPEYKLRDPDACVEIMTGAILPRGTDTVIRYEDLSRNESSVTLLIEDLRRGQNVHKQGIDRKKGDVIVDTGALLGAPELGIAATVGKSTLKVKSLPEIAIVTTGNELIGVDETPLPHQIRASNGYMLQASLQDMGLDAAILHLRDEQKEVTTGIEALLKDFNVVIFIGGSSMGKYDLIPQTLRNLGVKEHFYKIKQRPGKPFWFGTRADENFIFALPGNPISCFLCLEKYFKSWLRKSLGLYKKPLKATLKDSFSFEPPLTYFLQVKLDHSNGSVFASPVPGGGSGDLANLTRAQAFMQLPDTQSQFRKGDTYPIITFR